MTQIVNWAWLILFLAAPVGVTLALLLDQPWFIYGFAVAAGLVVWLTFVVIIIEGIRAERRYHSRDTHQ